MANVDNLVSRIQAEISSHREKLMQVREEQVEEHKERQSRLEAVELEFDRLREIWKPRLEALAEQFKDSVKVTPTITPGRRSGAFEFQSPLARVNLRFAASTDADVRNVILTYDLQILPIYMAFEKHSEIEFPIANIDVDAVAQWLDERVISFVRVYLSLYENDYYLKDHMVEDPIAHVRFPKFVAGGMLERNGQKYYFISEETRSEFEKLNG